MVYCKSKKETGGGSVCITTRLLRKGGGITACFYMIIPICYNLGLILVVWPSFLLIMITLYLPNILLRCQELLGDYNLIIKELNGGQNYESKAQV